MRKRTTSQDKAMADALARLDFTSYKLASAALVAHDPESGTGAEHVYRAATWGAMTTSLRGLLRADEWAATHDFLTGVATGAATADARRFLPASLDRRAAAYADEAVRDYAQLLLNRESRDHADCCDECVMRPTVRFIGDPGHLIAEAIACSSDAARGYWGTVLAANVCELSGARWLLHAHGNPRAGLWREPTSGADETYVLAEKGDPEGTYGQAALPSMGAEFEPPTPLVTHVLDRAKAKLGLTARPDLAALLFAPNRPSTEALACILAMHFPRSSGVTSWTWRCEEHMPHVLSA